MQVLPLLTPTQFNNKKRSRSEDDFDSNYLKKRLISSYIPSEYYKEYSRGLVTPHETTKYQTQQQPEYQAFMEDFVSSNKLNIMDMLKDNNIPTFPLNKELYIPADPEAQSGQLVLYRPNSLLPISPPTTPTITEIESEDEETEEEDFEPMDLD